MAKKIKRRAFEPELVVDVKPLTTHLDIDLPQPKFELTFFPGNDKPWFAVAYGDPLPRRGLAAYGYTPWDAISNAAIHAANYEFSDVKNQAKDKPPKPARKAANK